MPAARGDAIVLFGAMGDLARKKILPSLYRLARRERLGVPIVGVARSALSDGELAGRVRTSLEEPGQEYQDGPFRQLVGWLGYVGGSYEDAALYDHLAEHLAGARRPLFYLAIPPARFPDVIRGLSRVGLNRTGRMVVEKPFGRDLASARALNALLRETFPESAVFRIDHFLGKEPVQNLLVSRFANTLLEPVWNRRYVSSIQITLAGTVPPPAPPHAPPAQENGRAAEVARDVHPSGGEPQPLRPVSGGRPGPGEDGYGRRTSGGLAYLAPLAWRPSAVATLTARSTQLRRSSSVATPAGAT